MRSLNSRHWQLATTWLAVLFLIGLGLIFTPQYGTHAAGVTVGDATSLINAINAANGTSEPDTITLSGNIILTSVDNELAGEWANGLPVITSEVMIDGSGFAIERDSSRSCGGSDTGEQFRIFYVAATGNLTLENVTVRNGCIGVASPDSSGAQIAIFPVQPSPGLSPSAFGAGILNHGVLTITNSTLSDNLAHSGGGIANRGMVSITNSELSSNVAFWTSGGGIDNRATGTMSITNSTLSDNLAEGGGGIANSGMMTIANSTISNNTAVRFHIDATLPSRGGGILNGGTMSIANSTMSGNSGDEGAGIFNNSTLTINSSTMSGNTGWFSGGIANSGTVTITNSIVANSAGGDCTGDGTYNATNNLAAAPCGTTLVTNLDPILADNGGLTPTHALLPGSNAVDAVSGCPPPDADQRGFGRPVDGDANGSAECDIGAYELGAVPNQPPTVDAGGPYSVDEGDSLTLNGSGTDPEGDAVTFAWDLDNNGSFETIGNNPTFSAAGRDGPESQTIVLRVCDPDDACQSVTTAIDIRNVPPTITNLVITPGDSYQLAANFTDPGPDTQSAAINWGDGVSEVGTVDQNADTVSGWHNYAADGQYRVEVCVTDDDGDTGCRSATITISSGPQRCEPPGQSEPPRGVPECVPPGFEPPGANPPGQNGQVPPGPPVNPPGRSDNPPGRRGSA